MNTTTTDRSASGREHVLRRRVCIRYSDDALFENSLANMHRLVRAAQESDPACGSAAVSSTSAVLARKALRYRKKLARARAADVDDPTFDVAVFMGVTWCRTATPS